MCPLLVILTCFCPVSACACCVVLYLLTKVLYYKRGGLGRYASVCLCFEDKKRDSGVSVWSCWRNVEEHWLFYAAEGCRYILVRPFIRLFAYGRSRGNTVTTAARYVFTIG